MAMEQMTKKKQHKMNGLRIVASFKIVGVENYAMNPMTDFGFPSNYSI